MRTPATGRYLNPVTLIIDADTWGAAEVFTIAMKQLPQIKIIGENTAGSFSDILVRPLPNRWAVGMSHKVYRDATGDSYEKVGVTPEVNVPVFQLENIWPGVDPALDLALSSQ